MLSVLFAETIAQLGSNAIDPSQELGLSQSGSNP
jgi:hypothetical protein